MPEAAGNVVDGMRFIWVYLWMVWVLAVYHIVSISLQSEYEPMDLPFPGSVVLMSALYGAVLWAIRRGYSWARLVLVVVCALHLFGDLYGFDSHELAESLLSLIFTALPGVGAIWLFTRESKQWFEEVSAARARRE